MFLKHMMSVLYHPKDEWQAIESEHYTLGHIFLAQISVLALIPSVSLFIGATQVGWSITGGNFVKLSASSALPAAVLFYVAMWFAAGFMAYTIRWMEKTYGGKVGMDECMVLTVFTATPLFLSGFAALYPLLWFNVAVGLLAVCYSVFLLYCGVPRIMHIPEDRAFFFATSILTVGLCVLVGMLAVTVILWTTIVPLTYVAG